MSYDPIPARRRPVPTEDDAPVSPFAPLHRGTVTDDGTQPVSRFDPNTSARAKTRREKGGPVIIVGAVSQDVVRARKQQARNVHETISFAQTPSEVRALVELAAASNMGARVELDETFAAKFGVRVDDARTTLGCEVAVIDAYSARGMPAARGHMGW